MILLVHSLNDEDEEVVEEGSTILGNFAQDIFVQHEAEDEEDEIFPVTIREVTNHLLRSTLNRCFCKERRSCVSVETRSDRE